MPIEQRKIIFSDEELSLAIGSYSRVTPNFLPPGDIQAVRLDMAGDIKLFVNIRMRYGDGSQFVEIEMKTPALVELLILACLENNIPIPRRADKVVSLANGVIALVLEIASEDGHAAATQESPPRFAAVVGAVRRPLLAS